MHSIPAFECDQCHSQQYFGDDAYERMLEHEAIPVEPDDVPIGTILDVGPSGLKEWFPLKIVGTRITETHERYYSVETRVLYLGTPYVMTTTRKALKADLETGFCTIHPTGSIESSPG